MDELFADNTNYEYKIGDAVKPADDYWIINVGFRIFKTLDSFMGFFNVFSLLSLSLSLSLSSPFRMYSYVGRHSVF